LGSRSRENLSRRMLNMATKKKAKKKATKKKH
jgi:hypothetical protein